MERLFQDQETRGCGEKGSDFGDLSVLGEKYLQMYSSTFGSKSPLGFYSFHIKKLSWVSS